MKIFVITKRTVVIALAVLALIILGLVIWLFLLDGSATAVNAPPAEEYELTVMAGAKKELPVYSVQRSDKKIALTIDAAWEDDKTPFILETLDSYGVKATFFLCGFWVDKYPEEVKQLFDAGHELGNHTATHPHMNSISKAQIKKELEDFEKKVEKITGQRTTVFRAPYGEYNDTVITTVRSLGYEVIQWNIDTVDTVWMT